MLAAAHAPVLLTAVVMRTLRMVARSVPMEAAMWCHTSAAMAEAMKKPPMAGIWPQPRPLKRPPARSSRRRACHSSRQDASAQMPMKAAQASMK